MKSKSMIAIALITVLGGSSYAGTTEIGSAGGDGANTIVCDIHQLKPKYGSMNWEKTESVELSGGILMHKQRLAGSNQDLALLVERSNLSSDVVYVKILNPGEGNNYFFPKEVYAEVRANIKDGIQVTARQQKVDVNCRK